MVNNDDFIDSIKEHLARNIEYEKRENIAINRNKTEIKNLICTVNNILKDNGIDEEINENHIEFRAYYIGNIFKDDKKLSNIIFDHIYPRLTNKKSVSHFTSIENAKSIVSNSEFRMYSLNKNFESKEFCLFYRNHSIDGYEEKREVFGEKLDYESIMSQIFSLSFTSKDNDSKLLWSYFGSDFKGVKLTFQITSMIPDFRQVYYQKEKSSIKLLKDLFETINKKFGLPLTFTYISRIGAFYIWNEFKEEDEYRLLVKTTADNYDANGFNICNDKTNLYIVLPFQSDFATIKLVKVEKGKKCDQVDFESLKEIIRKHHKNVDIIE